MRFTYISRRKVSTKHDSYDSYDFIKSINQVTLETDVTGGLIFSDNYIAQAIEGDEAIVQNLASNILSDLRHELCAIVEQRPIDTRLFRVQSLGYSGQSTFVSEIINRCLTSSGEDRERKLSSMLELMRELEKSPIDAA